MKIAITLPLFFITLIAGAQGPDLERLQREIEVGENILASLWEEAPGEGETDVFFFGRRSEVEGGYLDGFGVLFTISSPFSTATIGNGNQVFIYQQGSNRILSGKVRPGEEEKDQAADTPLPEDHFRRVAEEYMAEYAYLLRELPAGEKIMIRFGNRDANVLATYPRGVRWTTGKNRSSFSAVLAKKEVIAYQDGRIDRSQLAEKIQYTFEAADEPEADRDLELLSSVFDRLYESDLSEDFFISGHPSYEKIPGVGAILHVSLSSRYLDWPSRITRLRFGRGNTFRYLFDNDEDTEGEEEDPNDDKPEATEKVDAAYPAFLGALLENVVEYGSIVKTLGPEEALLFRVELPPCDDCEVMPAKLEITARKAVLESYRKGAISLDEAVDQLVVSGDR
jgi:hypothetical protein